MYVVHVSPQQKQVEIELKELRNKSFFGFFMLNALFVLIVFLLQLNKDELHIDWPLGIKENITIIPDTQEVTPGASPTSALVAEPWHDPLQFFPQLLGLQEYFGALWEDCLPFTPASLYSLWSS